MSLTASDSGGADFAITPEGQYVARCYRVVDMGTQTINSPMFGTSEKHQVMISWELIGQDDPKMEDGRPFSAHQTYTVSLHEKAKLRADLESWRGKKFTTEELAGFDLGTIIGKYCMIQVVHSADGKYANVQTIMAYKGDKPKPVNPNVVFDIDKPDMEVLNSLSDNMQAKIKNTPEWAAYENPPKPEISAIQQQQKDMGTLENEPVNVDDIPF
jgi:hypothetical protein